MGKTATHVVCMARLFINGKVSNRTKAMYKPCTLLQLDSTIVMCFGQAHYIVDAACRTTGRTAS